MMTRISISIHAGSDGSYEISCNLLICISSRTLTVVNVSNTKMMFRIEIYQFVWPEMSRTLGPQIASTFFSHHSEWILLGCRLDKCKSRIGMAMGWDKGGKF